MENSRQVESENRGEASFRGVFQMDEGWVVQGDAALEWSFRRIGFSLSAFLRE
jgi:hypothetical protein